MSRKDLHDILGEALKYARRGDFGSVYALTCLYSDIAREIYSNPRSELDLLCDRCMNSCVMSVSPLFEGSHKAFLEDAESTYRGLATLGKRPGKD